ncbi:site-2 protease family protein [Pseudoalteromonas xiamenensis]|uniref:metalloprotease n=1 Tax=Pseudoalteromonas xiamenensis TaxID=882626 RepID=UPI0027E3D4FF|nr:site-2 protease family protein [Pseudoalteromonas xiamenensis]WMN61311.1 site-2 protease family protein [Pseudoalteromonas xiamenensis]
MNRIELHLANKSCHVLYNQHDILQVYVDQQALPLTPIEANKYQVDIDGQQAILNAQHLVEGVLLVQIGNEPEFAAEVKHFNVEGRGGKLGVLALVFKLFKSTKVIKAALAGASVAGYAWLFSWQFALMLVLCLVVHEYGHVRAMQYFGIKTKGIYLIPFVGGLAVSDEKITTRWQDVVISLMGPAFGLLTSFLGVALYYATELEVFAGVAALSALINLFNLLPMLPLDGGHVLKSISFSSRSWVGLTLCLGGVLFGLWLSYTFGLTLLVLFLFLGTLEIIFEWRMRNLSHLLPLNTYGQVVSALMYLLVVLGHLAVIFHFADSEHPILSLPVKILSS